MDIYVKMLCKNSFFSIFLFFLDFNYDFIIHIDFSRIAASNTATDDITNYRSHIEYLLQAYNILVLSLHSKYRKMIASLIAV